MEKIDLLVEAERRGILPPEKAELLSEARRRGLVQGASEQTPSLRDRIAEASLGERTKQATHQVTEWVSSRDPGIDYHSGVADFGFRAGFSAMTNDAEKSGYLDKKVGKGNWGKDSFGAYFIKPEGMKALGVDSKMPVALDEQSPSRYDFADLAGDLPAIAGAVGFSAATGGMGALPAIGMTALGGALGKSVTEIGKNVAGYQDKTAGEVAADVVKEGAMAGAGEGGFRLFRGLGRKALAPQAKRMTPEKQALMDDALNLGFMPKAGQVTDAPILGRYEGMIGKIFGDVTEPKNSAAAQKNLSDLLKRLGPASAKSDVGQAVVSSIKQSWGKFADDASKLYGEVDALAQGPIIPTASLKRQAALILDDLPKTAKGEPIFASPETRKFLESIGELPESVTTTQMQQIRATLRDASGMREMFPGFSGHHRNLLYKAADESFDFSSKTGNKAAIDKLREADAFYRKGAERFDRPVIERLLKEASETGSVDPDMAVEYIVRKGAGDRVLTVKKAVSPEAWQQVQRAHGEKLLSSAIRDTSDPLRQVFDGNALKRSLDSYGPEVLEQVYGKEFVRDVYKFANVLKLVDKGNKNSGGLVAANIALHPLRNLQKLTMLRVLSKFMTQPGGLRYLTNGIQAPKTRAGAAALARVSSQLAALADDETGSANFVLTPPDPPQQ